MATKNLRLNLATVALIAIISMAFVILTSSGQFTQLTGAAVTVTELMMPFPSDAGGYHGWGNCVTQDKGRAWADQYCKAKGYTGVNSCYHEYIQKWKWAGTAANPVKGAVTSSYAFTKIRCTSGVPDAPIPTNSTNTTNQSTQPKTNTTTPSTPSNTTIPTNSTNKTSQPPKLRNTTTS